MRWTRVTGDARLGEPVGGLDAEQAAADHDRARAPAGAARMRLDVGEVAERDDAGQVHAGLGQADRDREPVASTSLP